MELSDISGPVAPPARRPVVEALRAGAVAAIVNTLIVVLARSADVSMRLPDDGEAIPLLAFAQFTILAALLGAGLAAVLRRRVAEPALWFTRLAVVLTVASLVPPLLVEGARDTVAVLLLTHVVAALFIIPAVAGSEGPAWTLRRIRR